MNSKWNMETKTENRVRNPDVVKENHKSFIFLHPDAGKDGAWYHVWKLFFYIVVYVWYNIKLGG